MNVDGCWLPATPRRRQSGTTVRPAAVRELMVLGGVQPDERTDSELVLAARGDDSDAFGQLFGRWFDRSWNVARNIIRQDDLAAEIAQDAMLSAWQRLDQLQDPDAFGGWLLRITRNRALNRLEHERRSRASGDEIVSGLRDRQSQLGQENPAGAQTPLSVDALVEMQDRQELVWAAAAALGERDASLLDLHLRHGLSPAEIAQELGVEANSAHQQLFRLRNKLGDVIGSYLLWRNGRPLCRGLAAAVSGDVAFDNSVSRAVAKHQAVCSECSERRDRLVDPAKLFASVPLVAVPLQLKVGAAAALQAAGVPVDPTSIAASAGPGAGGPGAGGSGPGSSGGPGGPGTGGPGGTSGTGGPGGVGSSGGPGGAGGGVGSSPSAGLGDLGLAGPGNGIPAVTEPATLTTAPQPAFEVAGGEVAGGEAPAIDPGQPTTILSQVEAPPAPKAPETVASAFEEWSRGVAWTFSRRAWGRSAAIVVGVVIALLGFVALSDSSSLADFLPFVSDDDDRAIASGAIAGPSANSEVSGSASAESTSAEDVLAVDPSTTAESTTSATEATNTTEASTTSASSTTESSTTTESTTTSASTTETTASTSSSTTSESTTTETTSSSTSETTETTTSSSSSSSETTQPPPPPNIIRFTNRLVTNLECNNPNLRPYDAIWLTENADSVELTLPTGNVVQGPPTGTHRFCAASGQQLVLRALGPGGEDKATTTLR